MVHPFMDPWEEGMTEEGKKNGNISNFKKHAFILPEMQCDM